MNSNRRLLPKESFLLLFLTLLCGCTAISDGFDSARDLMGLGPQAPAPTINALPTATPVPEAPATPKNIELIWQVPNEPVEAYHLYVIDPKGEEKRHYRIEVSKLKKEDDATYGPIYRYQVPDALKGEASTIRIRAENRFGLSDPSEPMIVGQ